MSNLVTIQNSLAAGELSPALYGRTDLEKWHSGLSTCRNFFANYQGGVASRAGLAYVGTCKQAGTLPPPRDIPFQFSIDQGYALEFGDQYLRIKVDGAYITETAKVVSSVSGAGLFTTSTNHGYSVGDWVYDLGNEDFNGLAWIVNTTPTLATFTVTDLFGNVISASASSGAGTVARIYTVTSPYADDDLPYLKYTQSADVMTLCCVNPVTGTEYPSYQLIRSGLTSWAFTADTFSTTISPPGNLTISAVSSTTPSTWYSYVVTAVSEATGEESVAGNITSIFNNDISVALGSNTLSWSAVAGAKAYNIYASIPSYGYEPPVSSIFGFIGSATGPGFTDTNILPDFSIPPPLHNNPFGRGEIQDVVISAQGGNYSQSTVGYSITTSTGTGFSGYPVVMDSKVKGFFITNHGIGYAPGDTITFTDSGGGTAHGTITFSSQPGDKTAITLNSVPLEFVDQQEGLSDQQVSLAGTLALTLQNLANFLNSASFLSWSVARYTSDATHLFITYKTHGAAGNAYVTSNGDATQGGAAPVSGASGFGNLTGGGTAGTGATGNLTIGPATGTYPSVPAYFQQRRVYANSMNDPDTYWMSKPGLFNNFDRSIPTVSDDSIEGTPWAQQVNGIQWLVPMPGGLVTLTGKGAWQVNGGGQNAAITPDTQFATPQAYNGSNPTVPPIVINYDILYVQSKGSIVRDLSYNFYVNIYTGTDLTVLSSHLFNNTQITQWAWAEEPWKILWVLRADGTLLSLTYLKEQEIAAWARHDTQGQFVSVCSITEKSNTNNSTVSPFVDSLYVIVKRYVQGAWRYYSERMDSRLWKNVEDTFAVDAGLSYPITYPAATLSPAKSEGFPVLFTASASVFTADNVGDVIRIDGGKATVTEYVSATQVYGNITETLVDTIPFDPLDTPAPAQQGLWSISTPTTEVSGLNHLEAKTVTILADGSVLPNQCVTDGTITLPFEASKIVVGLPYVCQMQTLYVDAPSQGGTSQNKRKLISSAGIRVKESRGLQVGSDQPDQATLSNSPTNPEWTNMNEVKDRTMFVNAGTAVPLFTGDYYKNISSEWTVKGQLAVQQVYPLPANILSVILYWTLADER